MKATYMLICRLYNIKQKTTLYREKVTIYKENFRQLFHIKLCKFDENYKAIGILKANIGCLNFSFRKR